MIRKKDFSEFSCLNETRINPKFCDINIRVCDRSFPCHRIILFATMKYFYSMFGGEYAEANNQEIELKDVNADDFEQLLAFVYGESVPVNEENVLRLLLLANYLGLETMEASCTEYIIENHGLLFSWDSVVDIFKVASTSGNKPLTDILTEYLAENFVAASAKSEKLYHVSGSDLLKIFTDPHLERKINVILTFLKKWIKCHADEEKELLPDMLSALHLEKGMAEWILEVLVRKDNCAPHKDHGSDSQLHSNPEQEQSRGAVELPFLLLTRDDDYLHHGNNGEPPTRLQCIGMYKFQSTNNVVKKINNRLYCEEEHFQGKFFSVGGTEIILKSEIITKSTPHTGRNVIQLYARNNSWLDGTVHISTYHGVKCGRSMLIYGPAYEHNIITAAVIGTDIYIYDNVELISFACGHSRWSTVHGYCYSEMIYAPSMVSLGSCLYMVGGLGFTHKYPLTLRRNNYEMIRSILDGGAIGKSFSRYDVRENRWSSLSNLRYPRCKAAACVYNDTIYVSGGDHATYFNNSNIEYYDSRADKWSELTTQMPKAKMGHCLMAYNDHLWVFGGQDFGSDQFDPTWFSYNPKENIWSEVLSLRTVHGQHTIHQVFDVRPDVIK